MSPYRRNASTHDPIPQPNDTSGERAFLALLALLGALRVASAVTAGEVWGAEATVFALLGALALCGLLGRRARG